MCLNMVARYVALSVPELALPPCHRYDSDALADGWFNQPGMLNKMVERASFQWNGYYGKRVGHSFASRFGAAVFSRHEVQAEAGERYQYYDLDATGLNAKEQTGNIGEYYAVRWGGVFVFYRVDDVKFWCLSIHIYIQHCMNTNH